MTAELVEALSSDALWIVAALAFGLFAKAVRVPPLVGFLAAGFVLNSAGFHPTPFVEVAADLGVTVLLFTIGMHLSVRVFARTEVWGVAVSHVAGFSLLMFGLLCLGALVSLGPLAGMEPVWMASLAVALSFSSTVFTAKMLQARGSQSSRHGRVAMGVLIIQDIVAVTLLAIVVADTRPSPWMVALLALPLLRRPLLAVMARCGHGELLLLFGAVCAMGGAALFEAVGLKSDLGALAMGLLLAGTPRTDELAAKLDGFKDLFLAAFFVSVGLSAPLDPGGMALGLLLLVALPLKAFGFFALFSATRLRSRTAWQASLDLTTYSEFGLIVVAAEVEAGLVPHAWLATVAVAVAGSLVLASPFALNGDSLYTRWREPLRTWQRSARLEGDEDLHLRPVKVALFGIGRLGTAAMTAMEREFPDEVLGVDVDPNVVRSKARDGRNVVVGDATDAEFWSRTEGLLRELHWVLLTMSSHEANLSAIERLRARGYQGKIVATSRYWDQAAELREAGADAVFDVYTEAGAGFASDLDRRMHGYETGVHDFSGYPHLGRDPSGDPPALESATTDPDEPARPEGF